MQENQKLTIWESLLSLDRRILYLILMLLVGWQVISPLDVGNVVSVRTKDLFDYLNSLKEGDVVVIESDWTYSTKGESLPQFQALMRLLMRKKIKFIITSIDPQAPRIASYEIEQLAVEPGSNNYMPGKDYFVAGYFPDAYNHVKGMVNNIRKELSTRGALPFLIENNISDLSQIKIVLVVTGSSSIDVWYERIRNKTKLGLFCTAVMSAENILFYASGQLVGIVIGAKGAFDFESLLAETFKEPEYTNFQSGRRYMGPLAFALMLLVLAVIIGNLALFFSRRRGARS
ncbi:MAG TPA: hypothetical protein VNK96_04230 [Fimbriimonadales bacterium]|nr:hypothetical protein [Fimbriimonadales bacterium]